MKKTKKKVFCPNCAQEMARSKSQPSYKTYPIEWKCANCGLTTFQPARKVWLTFKEYNSTLLSGA